MTRYVIFSQQPNGDLRFAFTCQAHSHDAALKAFGTDAQQALPGPYTVVTESAIRYLELAPKTETRLVVQKQTAPAYNGVEATIPD